MRVAIGKGIEWASLEGHDSGTKGIKCSSVQFCTGRQSAWQSLAIREGDESDDERAIR
jgi:hypothetical protein